MKPILNYGQVIIFAKATNIRTKKESLLLL
jgi:hypothetical protein